MAAAPGRIPVAQPWRRCCAASDVSLPGSFPAWPAPARLLTLLCLVAGAARKKHHHMEYLFRPVFGAADGVWKHEELFVEIPNGKTCVHGIIDPRFPIKNVERVLLPAHLPDDPPATGVQGDHLPHFWNKEPVTTPEEWMDATSEDLFDRNAKLSELKCALYMDEEGRCNHWKRLPVNVRGYEFFGPVALVCWYEEEESGAQYHVDVTPEIVASLSERLRLMKEQQQAHLETLKAHGFTVEDFGMRR